MSRIGAIKAIKNSILKVMAPAHLMGTVPVIANGGSGAQPGPCLSVKKGGIALHGATSRDCDVGHTWHFPAAANSPQKNHPVGSLRLFRHSRASWAFIMRPLVLPLWAQRFSPGGVILVTVGSGKSYPRHQQAGPEEMIFAS